MDFIEASKIENVIDINIEPVDYDTEHIFLRATQDGKVELTNDTIQVADKKYMLNKTM